jgi:phospholipase/carboxylesterase
MARWLIVLCHGIGADGHQLDRLQSSWARAVPNAAFLAPHAPRRRASFALALLPGRLRPRGREWFSLADKALQVQAAGVQSAAARLNALIDAELRRLALPADACALMGYSQGAIVALLAGLRRDIPPRALVSLSGGLSPLEAFEAELHSRVPVLLLHGANDRVVPPRVSERAQRQLVARAIPVTYRPLPATAHEIDEAGISVGAAFIRRMLA